MPGLADLSSCCHGPGVIYIAQHSLQDICEAQQQQQQQQQEQQQQQQQESAGVTGKADQRRAGTIAGLGSFI
jgi:hypothetical protein